jgi:diguanylate cyclase (GGDEF)-like protein
VPEIALSAQWDRKKMETDESRTATTAIWNRESIVELLARELARTAHEGRDLFVLLVGLDQLQDITARYGPSQGDRVLGEVAKRLNAFMRSYDHVGRYGAEQLLVLCLSYDLAGIVPLAEKLRQTVEQLSVEISGTRVPVTISISLATASDFRSSSHYELLRELENGLYRAHAQGGNRVERVRPARAQSVIATPPGDRTRLRAAVSFFVVAAIVVALIWISPAWTCAPFRVRDVVEGGELPPPLPVNCGATADVPSDSTLESLDQQREARGLLLQETVTCKISLPPKARRERGSDQQWLPDLYVNGRYQYRRHVFLATSQDVPGGTLFTVEVCLMPWWDYLKQPGDACWGQYAFWR